jgi:hypothetical protein
MAILIPRFWLVRPPDSVTPSVSVSAGFAREGRCTPLKGGGNREAHRRHAGRCTRKTGPGSAERVQPSIR